MQKKPYTDTPHPATPDTLSDAGLKLEMDLIADPVTDPSDLPKACFLHVIAQLMSGDALERFQTTSPCQPVACTGFCALTACSLVSKRWRSLLQSDEADATLWRRLRLEDCCLSRQLNFERFRSAWKLRAPRLAEIDVDLSVQCPHQHAIETLTRALPDILRESTNLVSLRISGPLPLGDILTSVDLRSFPHLSSVYFNGGEEPNWGLQAAVCACVDIKSLERLEIRIPNDAELVEPEVIEALANLTRLRHLSLQWPLRSALPPTGDLPAHFSKLSELTTLQLRRVPLQNSSPEWLGNLQKLRHLFWDPYLPVDATGQIPSSLHTLTALKTLYIEMRLPIELPAGLSGLEKLIVLGRGTRTKATNGAAHQQWEWLNSMTQLKSLRLQGAHLDVLPEPVRILTGLTRLGLMCNELSASGLPGGPWTKRLEYLHLGNNCIHNFPTALRSATNLRSLHLANQRSGPGVTNAGRNASQRLTLKGGDVSALLGMPQLEVVVMSMAQAMVQLGGRLRDFEWLQRILRQRKGTAGESIRLTSNELVYKLEPLEVFRVERLTPNEIKEAS